MKSELIYGFHAVQALLEKAPHQILEIFVQKSRSDQRLQKVLAIAEQQQLSVHPVNLHKLETLAHGQVHQGIVARVKMQEALPETALFDLLEQLSEPAFLLILDHIQDPHNLGACLRTADAVGVHAVIAPKNEAVGLTATARKVACGGAESVPFIQVTNLVRTIDILKEKGIWVMGTADQAHADLFQTKLTQSMAFVMGAEGKGMRPLTQKHCDELIRIPMKGSVSSLNVSVATAICLFETYRQRS